VEKSLSTADATCRMRPVAVLLSASRRFVLFPGARGVGWTSASLMALARFGVRPASAVALSLSSTSIRASTILRRTRSAHRVGDSIHAALAADSIAHRASTSGVRACSVLGVPGG
jgi:hypothetical protein